MHRITISQQDNQYTHENIRVFDDEASARNFYLIAVVASQNVSWDYILTR